MYTTHDALRPHFKALARVGYYKIVSETVTPTKVLLHNIYRILIWILVVATNIQHLIRIFQLLNDIDELNNIFLLVLTMLSSLSKQIIFNTKVGQISNAVSVISDIEFISKDIYVYFNKEMKACGTFLKRFLDLYNKSSAFCAILWAVNPCLKWVAGEDVKLSAYFPFNTSSSPMFQCTIIYVGLSFVVQAYGNTTMDCVIQTLYAQAQTQFKILQYSLEHLMVEEKNNTTTGRRLDSMKYENVLHERFVKCVKQYDRIVWYVKEVDSIFNRTIIVQVLATSVIVCTTVYRIVGLDILSFEFLITIVFLIVMLLEPYLYCYYGSQLTLESEKIINAAFNMKWEKMPPMFRRKLIIFMERCKRPVEPRIAFIIPLSLGTYITILRSAYALFTVLNSRKV